MTVPLSFPLIVVNSSVLARAPPARRWRTNWRIGWSITESLPRKGRGEGGDRLRRRADDGHASILLREVGKHRNALGYKELIGLKRLYRVSGAALLMRLSQLEVISESTLVYAFQGIARGWRTQEPKELESNAERWSVGTAAALRAALLPLSGRRSDFADEGCQSCCGFSRP